MSAPMYPGTPVPPARPMVVTVSSYLLYLSAAASIISAILSLTTVGATRRVYADLYAGTANSGLESVIVATSVVGVVINILVAAGLAILAIYNNRGRQAARVTTWVLGGLFLCCSGFGLLGNAATSGMNLDTGNTSMPSASEIEARLSRELPGWFTPISTTLTVLVMLALLGAVILLALPAANAYFRKPQAGAWDPMNPYPGYPGQPPAYPGYPSQSPYPGQPYPGQPGQPYPGQPGQPYPGQPGQAYPGQPYPGQAYPGQAGQPQSPPPAGAGEATPPPYPGTGGQPPQPQSPPPAGAGEATPPPGSAPQTDGTGSGPAPGPAGDEPHTGSVPPTDPWSAPPPPPASPSDDKPGRSPTDPA